jgi:hypothetical protein
MKDEEKNLEAAIVKEYYKMDVEIWRTGQKRLEAVKSFVAQLYIRRGDLMKKLESTETVKGVDKEIREMETQIQLVEKKGVKGEKDSNVLDAGGVERMIRYNKNMFKKKGLKPYTGVVPTEEGRNYDTRDLRNR